MDHFINLKQNDDMIEEDYDTKINIDDLYENQRQNEQTKEKIYQMILLRIHKKIKSTSRIMKTQKYIFYTIPEIMIGIPKYNVMRCIEYVVKHLIENGFIVKYTHPNLLFVSWEHYIPQYQRELIKERTGQNVDEYGNIIPDKKKKQEETMFNPKSILKNKENKNVKFKNVETFKPTGIYNRDLIENITKKLS